VRQLSAARIRAEHPEADEREVRVRVAALLYPAELMRRALDRVPEQAR
jgi:DNA-directed RNA polymerase subunit L